MSNEEKRQEAKKDLSHIGAIIEEVTEENKQLKTKKDELENRIKKLEAELTELEELKTGIKEILKMSKEIE